MSYYSLGASHFEIYQNIDEKRIWDLVFKDRHVKALSLEQAFELFSKLNNPVFKALTRKCINKGLKIATKHIKPGNWGKIEVAGKVTQVYKDQDGRVRIERDSIA